MSIPSYHVEGRGHNRRTTLTFYGTEPPSDFSAMGAEYRRVRECSVSRVLRRCGTTSGYLLTCGHSVFEQTRPRFCSKCGARVVA